MCKEGESRGGERVVNPLTLRIPSPGGLRKISNANMQRHLQRKDWINWKCFPLGNGLEKRLHRPLFSRYRTSALASCKDGLLNSTSTASS